MENPTTPSDVTGDDPQAAQPNIIMITVDQMRFPMHFPNSLPLSTENSNLVAKPFALAVFRTTFLIQTEGGYYPEPRGESSTPNGR